jgi:hypothetical protein
MITINQIKTEIRFETAGQRLELEDMLDSREVLQKKAAKILGINMTDVSGIVILKHSIDARKKPQIFQVYTLGITLQTKELEERVVRRCRNRQVAMYTQKQYRFPVPGKQERTQRPVVIGMGPAGLFCGLMLRISARTARLQADHTGARF